MKIKIGTVEQATVVELVGDVDTNTAPEVQDKVLPLVQEGSKILLNLTGVAYMSSAGLRLLLSLYRRASSQSGNLVLVGINEYVKDTMEATGFLNFFTICDTIDAGLEELNK